MAEEQTGRLDGTHVLVVEDDDSSRRMLQRALESWGALVGVAPGADALHIALRADVIVIDLATAEAAGCEFLFHLRRLHNRATRPVPIIALVPYGVPVAATPRSAGVQRYLVKPAEPDELRAAVWEFARE